MLIEPPCEDEIGHEDDDVDGDQRPRHVCRIGGIRAAGAVELATCGEVVARLLEQPGDAVGDGAAFLLRCPPIGLTVGVDRLLQVPVANVLLGSGAPCVPGERAVQLGGVLPADQRARLVVHPVLGGALADQGGATHLGIRIGGQGVEDGQRGFGLGLVEQALAVGQPRPGIVGHRPRIIPDNDRPPGDGTPAVDRTPP